MAGGEHNNEMDLLPPQSLSAQTPFGSLTVISIEIRLGIYSTLIGQDQLAIVRRSRAINKEAGDDFTNMQFAPSNTATTIDTPYHGSVSEILTPEGNFKDGGRMSHINHFSE